MSRAKLFFWVSALAVCLFFGWSSNPVHQVLSLVVLGLAVAAGLLAQGLQFVAALLVLVYVGAVTVLFVFVVMMVNLRAVPSLYTTAEGPAAVAVLAVLATATAADSATESSSWATHEDENLASLGGALYTTDRVTHVLVVGAVLFVAMVAAICLSLVAGENYRTQEVYSQIRKPGAVFVLC